MAVVLIADPNTERLIARRKRIRMDGHRTLVSTDGPSCLRIARDSRPALIVAEVALPGLDGYGLALSVREEMSSTVDRVLLLKGRLTEDDRSTASVVGAHDIFQSSADPADLMDAVRETLALRSPPEGGICGTFDTNTLFAILQFLHQRRVTGTLSLSGVPGTIAFAGGEVTGARCRGHDGMDAFVSILRASEGRYCFDAGLVDPMARNVDATFDTLLFDAFAALNEES